MKPEDMKELLWSLAWYPFSNHHNKNVHKILHKAYPDLDWDRELEEFTEIYLSKQGPGSPK